MSLESKQEQPIPLFLKLRNAFYESAINAVLHLMHMHWLEDDYRLTPFIALVKGFVNYGVITRTTTELYDQDMETVGRNAIMRRPFAIELDTLSPNVQLVLYPQMIFKPTEGDIQAAKQEGLEMRTQGGQAMIYILDGFETDTGDTENMTANLYFVGHMTNALLEERYPLEIGERSPEFKKELKQALDLVREYARMLPEDRKGKLSSKISRIVSLDDVRLDDEARKFALYHVEPMKMPGLYEPEQANVPEETPEQAVQNGVLFLHLDERGLPQRVKDNKTVDVPSLPWVEYGKNRWNRNKELFGRYETPTEKGYLRIDFRLNSAYSTHTSTLYGFFDTIEVTKAGYGGIREHIIFGQQIVENEENLASLQFFGAKLIPEQLQDSAIPVIVAGDFDFTNPQTRDLLGKLASDKGTKPDVGRVITDILRLSQEERLQRP